MRLLGTQKFDTGHGDVILEDVPQKSIDLDSVVARIIPRHNDIAGREAPVAARSAFG